MRICGVDEVGYSSIAGPVFACAAVLDSSIPYINGVADSKTLSRKRREELNPLIREKAVFAFGAAGPREIERINIYWARYRAMERAVKALLRRRVRIDLVLVDGNRTIPDLPDWIRQEARPKADADFWEVSCASILAKVARDNLMTVLARRYPGYGWETNCGYHSPAHRKGIILGGPTPFHRRTFSLFKSSEASHIRYSLFRAAGGGTLEEFLRQENDKIGGIIKVLSRTAVNDIGRPCRSPRQTCQWLKALDDAGFRDLVSSGNVPFDVLGTMVALEGFRRAGMIADWMTDQDSMVDDVFNYSFVPCEPIKHVSVFVPIEIDKEP